MCTQEKLKKFDIRHYAYINQIFGCDLVREDLLKMAPHKGYTLHVEECLDSGLRDDKHHFAKRCGTKLCSIKAGTQNYDRDVHDALCQTYSLMYLFGYDYTKFKDRKQLQDAMVAMYRGVVRDPKFKEILNDIDVKPIKDSDAVIWPFRDFAGPNPRSKMRKTLAGLLKEINTTLDQWADYGYHYFIGQGDCPTQKTKKVTKKKLKRESLKNIK